MLNSIVSDTTLHPDFSTGAPPLSLGFWTGGQYANLASGLTITTISRMDNLRISLNHAVPEPSTSMLGLGALGLMLRRRRK